MIAALALAGSAAAYNATVTASNEVTKWVTIPCDTPTTLTYGSSTYTVTEATTLTVEDCYCTETPKVSAVPGNSTAPPLVNGAAAGKVGAAAGVAAAVAYLL